MRIAIFPGKFQPMHLGHILSICRVRDMGYEKILIILTHDGPKITTPEENISILKQVFKRDVELKKIEFMILPKTLLDETSLHENPNEYDIFSGNPKVLEWAKKYGYNPIYLERTNGFGYSGAFLREIWNGN